MKALEYKVALEDSFAPVDSVHKQRFVEARRALEPHFWSSVPAVFHLSANQVTAIRPASGFKAALVA